MRKDAILNLLASNLILWGVHMRTSSQESIDKNQLLFDVWDGRIPKRVPLLPFFGIDVALEYAGIQTENRNLKAQEILNAAEYLSGAIKSDILPIAFLSSMDTQRFAYPDLGKIRCFSELCEYNEIAAKHKKATVPFCGFAATVPLECMHDGYSAKNAYGHNAVKSDSDFECNNYDALLRKCCFNGMGNGTKYDRIALFPILSGEVNITEFENVYWPNFQSFCNDLDFNGYGISLILDAVWENYTDFLLDLPENTQIKFRTADAKLIKSKLGARHILCGLYPAELLQSGNQQECCDKAKQLLDILAPGGRYSFGLNRIIHKCGEIHFDNLNAVLETAERYGKY